MLRAGSPRLTRANVLAMVLAGALGFAIIAQVRQTSIQGLENLREDELVRIFAGVEQMGVPRRVTGGWLRGDGQPS